MQSKLRNVFIQFQVTPVISNFTCLRMIDDTLLQSSRKFFNRTIRFTFNKHIFYFILSHVIFTSLDEGTTALVRIKVAYLNSMKPWHRELPHLATFLILNVSEILKYRVKWHEMINFLSKNSVPLIFSYCLTTFNI